jgi:hypothetical protein
VAGVENRRGGAAAALGQLAHAADGPRLSLGDVVDALGEQGFGLLVLVLALPNLVPGPIIPGFSIPFALGIALLGAQIMAGLHTPRLPGWLKRRGMTLERFHRLAQKAEPQLHRLERLVRPRPNWLTGGRGERLVGAVLIVLSLVLALPVPLGNAPIALMIGIIALGLLEGDGVALGWGIAGGVLAVLWNGMVLFAGTEIVKVAAEHLR